ncbi:hypothetical protein VP01_968g2 [Puccinia sorghi]|uniref:WLM domain-containing protein n=1 Tax=Puccinia sorghi TaxID=27349 RepID=A0A0L6U602_9BASI|nr:hypothetical protein VP01_968g2 [Puccinia sorghi]
MPRINASQHEHPNPYINFIRVLGDQPADKLSKNKNFQDSESARLIMRAISAVFFLTKVLLLKFISQVVPLMKAHGMGLNSLNEYEWNPEFAGRNVCDIWNGGEIIELVLRRRDGSFLVGVSIPMGYLLTVMAHELAHIHHSAQFQKLNLQLRKEIQQLQQRGYYGPGFWSSGQRLRDSAVLHGDGSLTASDLPELTCGGSQRQGTRRKVYRPRAVTKRTAACFVGDGQKLEVDGPSSFRKRANAAAAKNARALAAERRLQESLKSKSTSITSESSEVSVEEEEIEEVEVIKLNDEWEDFEPQVPQSAVETETEKGCLREEIKGILDNFRKFQPNISSSFNQSTSAATLHEDEIQVIHETNDENEIEIIKQPSLVKPDGKNKPPFKTFWKCLVCYEENHVDLSRCSSCSRPKGSPAPKWNEN